MNFKRTTSALTCSPTYHCSRIYKASTSAPASRRICTSRLEKKAKCIVWVHHKVFRSILSLLEVLQYIRTTHWGRLSSNELPRAWADRVSNHNISMTRHKNCVTCHPRSLSHGRALPLLLIEHSHLIRCRPKVHRLTLNVDVWPARRCCSSFSSSHFRIRICSLQRSRSLRCLGNADCHLQMKSFPCCWFQWWSWDAFFAEWIRNVLDDEKWMIKPEFIQRRRVLEVMSMCRVCSAASAPCLKHDVENKFDPNGSVQPSYLEELFLHLQQTYSNRLLQHPQKQ